MRVVRRKRTARITMSTFPEAKAALQALADEHDLPLATFVRTLINEHLRASGLKRVGDRIVRRVA